MNAKKEMRPCPHCGGMIVWNGRHEARVTELEGALDALLEHAENIQEHVPKSENWYAVRDCARLALRRTDA